jgi:hypothetical protein
MRVFFLNSIEVCDKASLALMRKEVVIRRRMCNQHPHNYLLAPAIDSLRTSACATFRSIRPKQQVGSGILRC